MQKFSFHTHTIGFDGRNSEEDMVRRAEELGWDKIGFSNHLMVHERIEEAPMFQYAKKVDIVVFIHRLLMKLWQNLNLIINVLMICRAKQM